MAIEVFNRYEKKYVISEEVYQRLKPILEDYMEVDAHSRNGDFYTICNIYYDSPSNEIVRKSIDKPAYKQKLRLRGYGVAGNKDKVYLEIKKKFNGLVNKRRTSLLLEDAYEYFEKRKKPEIKSYMNEQILTEIDYMVQGYSLQPALFLSYDRNALFGIDEPEFRITFDTNIRTRRYDLGLDYGTYGDLMLPPNYWIMEAKMENAAPLWFAQILSANKIYPTSYSKYGTEYQKYILQADNDMSIAKILSV